jgi:hypothetical protein
MDKVMIRFGKNGKNVKNPKFSYTFVPWMK